MFEKVGQVQLLGHDPELFLGTGSFSMIDCGDEIAVLGNVCCTRESFNVVNLRYITSDTTSTAEYKSFYLNIHLLN